MGVGRPIQAKNFVGTMAANVDNSEIDDAEFREFVRNTLPRVNYDPGVFKLYESWDIGKGPERVEK